MLRDSSIVSASSEVMGGTLVFAGTRVPVETLLDYLKAGESVDDFLEGLLLAGSKWLVCWRKLASSW